MIQIKRLMDRSHSIKLRSICTYILQNRRNRDDQIYPFYIYLFISSAIGWPAAVVIRGFPWVPSTGVDDNTFTGACTGAVVNTSTGAMVAIL